MCAELSFYIHLHASMSPTCCRLVKTERRRGRAVCLPLLRCLHRAQPEHDPVRWPPQLCLLRGHASRRVFLMGVRPARRQLWRQAQRPAIPGGSAAQPPLLQGGAGGQGQLAACSAGLSRLERDRVSEQCIPGSYRALE